MPCVCPLAALSHSKPRLAIQQTARLRSTPQPYSLLQERPVSANPVVPSNVGDWPLCCLIDFGIALPFSRSPTVVFEVIGMLWQGFVRAFINAAERNRCTNQCGPAARAPPHRGHRFCSRARKGRPSRVSRRYILSRHLALPAHDTRTSIVSLSPAPLVRDPGKTG
jgi:hypothetical protein